MSTYDISRRNQTTRSADVFSIRKNLPHCRAAEAPLRGTSGIHGNQLSTSIFGFVEKFGDERRPASIEDRLGQHSSGETLDVQVFDNDCAEVSNKVAGLPMLKLISQTVQWSVNFLEQRNSLTSAVRTLLATGHPPLGATQFCFSVSMPSSDSESFRRWRGWRRI